MDITRWIDYTILFFLIFSAGCITLIHVRKTLKYGYLRAFIQPIDDFDKKLSTTSGTLFVIFFSVVRYKIFLAKPLSLFFKTTRRGNALIITYP